MPISPSRPRVVVTAVHTMIVITMLILMIGIGSTSHANPLVVAWTLLVPLLAIATSVLPIRRKERIVAYWLIAMMSAPLAILGAFGGWGMLYLIGIIFLLWSAWQENEGWT